MKISLTIVIVAFVALSLFQGCVNNSHRKSVAYWTDTTQLSHEDKELRKVWNNFRQAVLSNDPALLRSVSADCIYCSECPENNYHYKALPVDDFIKLQADNVFHSNANRFYFRDENIEWMMTNSHPESVNFICAGVPKPTNYKTLEVSIRNSRCHGPECSQTLFTFIDTGSGFKFNGIIHMP